MTLKDLLAKRAKITTEARAILDKAEKESRDLTAEEKQRHDAAVKDSLDVSADIDRYNRQAEAERQLAAGLPTTVLDQVQHPEGQETEGDVRAVRDRFARSLKTSARTLYALKPEEEARMLLAVGEHIRVALGLRGVLSDVEKRDLSFSLDTAGGYLVPPQEYIATIIKFVMNLVFMRQRATKYTLGKAYSLGVPTLTADPADADWTSEIAVGGTDTTMAIGKRELFPHALAKVLKVSEPLMRMSAIDVAGLIMERIGYKFAVTEEKAFLTGNGAQQPLGIFTASADGIDTSRDVSSGNTVSAVKFDGLYNAKYALKPQYWPRAAWMFNRTVIGQIATLKDGDGRYLWQQALTVGQPDTLLGFPLMMSEYVPNTMTTGLYVGCLGDYSFYWIADVLEFRVQVMRELYAAKNQIGFHCRKELDAMPVLAEAFVRVRLA